MKLQAISAGALLLLLAVVPAAAGDKPDKKAIREAYNAAKSAIDDKTQVDPAVDAVKALDGIIDYDTSLTLLTYFEETDMAWDVQENSPGAPKQAKGRPKESYKIATAILNTVRSMAFADEAAKFEKNILDRDKYALRPRMAMLDAIARHAGSHTECMRILRELVDDATKDTDMRILAITHLSDYMRDEAVVTLLLKHLKDRSWRVREVTIDALAQVEGSLQDMVIIALINQLAGESGKLRKNIGDALGRITGADKGTDPDAWSDWFKQKKREDQGLPEKKGGDKGTRVKVFKTETFSDRYVFLLDTSISMTQRITDEEKEKLKRSITEGPGDDKDPRKPLDWSKINCKLDLAREEIIRSLEVMDPERTRFTVITFSEKATVWKDELVPTDAKTIAELADYLRAIKGEKRTNVFGALDAAYDLSERLAGAEVDKRKGKKPSKKDGPVVTGPHKDEALPDTIFIYTDGYATWGKYGGDDKAWQGIAPEERAKLYAKIMVDMVAEIKDRNRIARITLNTIGVGNPQDNTTLGALARACGGQYVPIGK